MRRTPLAVALAAGAVAATAHTAHAFNPLTCGGDAIGITANTNLVMDGCSLPVGSDAEGDVLAAIGAWNSLQGMTDRFTASAGGTTCVVTHGDGQNDVAIAPRTGTILGGANGIAVYVGLVQMPQTCDDSEWDVILADTNLIGGPSDELDDSAAQRRGILVHELGHVLGLGHETSGLNAIMAARAGGAGTTYGPYGGRTATGVLDATQINAPHADDTAFVYANHSDGATSVDMAANAWMRSGDSMVLATTPTNLTVCNGGTVTGVSWSWHNRGTDDIASSDWSMVLSTDEVIDNTDAVVLTGTANGVHGWSTTNAFDFVVPETLGSAAGIVYRLGVIVDPAEAVTESIESNNATRLPVMVTVLDC